MSRLSSEAPNAAMRAEMIPREVVCARFKRIRRMNGRGFKRYDRRPKRAWLLLAAFVFLPVMARAQGTPDAPLPATQAVLTSIGGIAVDADGRLYIAVPDRYSVSIDGPWETVLEPGRILRLDANGLLTPLVNEGAARMVADSTGLYFVRSQHDLPPVIRRLNPDGSLVTLAGGGQPSDGVGDGGPALAARLYPAGSDRDANGNLFIADSQNHRIRKIDPNGIITTVAGTGRRGFSKDGIPATQASLTDPVSIALDEAGSLFISDGLRIRKVDAQGIISTYAGNGRVGYEAENVPATAASVHPHSLALDATGNLYFANLRVDHTQIMKVTPDGLLLRVAGPSASQRPGNVNGDGKLNIQDVTLALRAAVGLLSLPPRWLEAADLNDDGQVTIQDVVQVMRIVTGPA
jgi:sugar lactone lactonase YvrE